MCGRYKLTTDKKRLKEHFPWLDDGDYFDIHGPSQQHEIFPGTSILAINNRFEPEEDWWTIRDKNWQGKTVDVINAKAENVLRIPMFKDAFLTDRILIPATGLYEWQVQPDKSTVKYEIWFNDDVFAFAGIARECEIKGEIKRCGLIITTTPNEIFATIHNTKQRQAVVIRKDQQEAWLDPKTSPDRLIKMLQPLSAAETHFREVTPPPSLQKGLFE